MKKYLIIISLCILGLLITASSFSAIQMKSEKLYSYYELYNSSAPDLYTKRETLDIKPILYNKQDIKSLAFNGGIQVTTSEDNEAHPSIGLDSGGNPVITFDNQLDLFDSNIWICRSLDGGETWPEDYFVYWDSDTPGINPDISFFPGGVRAFSTYENSMQDPQLPYIDYVDINDPDTWVGYAWDLSGSGSYAKDTAITTSAKGAAVGVIRDYYSQGYELENTLEIFWCSDPDAADWQGVFWINQDTEGNSMPRTHLSAGSGDKTFVCFESRKQGESSRIYVSYVEITPETLYSDWKSAQVAGGKSNATNPNIAVSGNTAFIVYNDDKNGNQDIYCSTSTSGSFWKKNTVVESPDDELYPVITANGLDATCMFTKNGGLYSTSSEDGGVTWSEPVKVIDENTVVADYGYSDIIGPYGTWTDDRNGNDDIFFSSVGSAPLLSAEFTAGGLGVSVSISNNGNAPAEDVSWSISIDGLVFLGAIKEGTIVSIAPEETTTISSGFIFGFGKVTITVVVDDITLTATAFLLGPFLLNMQVG